MKKSKLFRTLTLAVAAALCMATTTVTAYAGGADPVSYTHLTLPTKLEV